MTLRRFSLFVLAACSSLDGDEAACAFGPVADPGHDFDGMPPAGTWKLLELLPW